MAALTRVNSCEDALARADVEVADLGVAHLPLRQADRRAGGRDRCVGPLARDGVEMRLRARATALASSAG